LPFSIVRFEEIDSTNHFLKEWGRHSPENGLVVIADCQTAGRGRLGRRWESPRNEGLYFSLLIGPVDPERAAAIPLIAGIALRDTLAASFPVLISLLDLKWPNDVLIGGKKVAGILAELETPPAQAPFVVLGVGVNCNQSEFPAELPRATSLRQALGFLVDRSSLVEAFLTTWHGYLTGEVMAALPEGMQESEPRPLGSGLSSESPRLRREGSEMSLSRVIEDWKQRSSFWNGKIVRLLVDGNTLEGITCDVAPSGALVVRLRSGEMKELLAGEVEWIPAANERE
jgi:biotin-[acetyl-CoA-carboxylase] ligase BirA-like protein